MDSERLDHLEKQIASTLSVKIMEAKKQYLLKDQEVPKSFSDILKTINFLVDSLDATPSITYDRNTHVLADGSGCIYLSKTHDTPCPKHQPGTRCEASDHSTWKPGVKCGRETNGYRLCEDHIGLVNICKDLLI